MKTLAILGCTKSKHTGVMEARRLYEKSNLFRLSKAFCKKNKFHYIIISAKYGLIHPNQEICDYNETFDSKKKIKEMSKIIIPGLKKLIKNYDRIVVLTGEKYIETFRPLIDNKFSFPLKCLPIGKRMQWLKKEVEK